ncbi:MAG TPA: ribonuclease PH [Firmicutes bacterium]|nr:ribonuclease PH [Bacillota bacterium]
MERFDGRRPDELRPVRLTRSFLKHAEGSCLIEVGETKVLCAATVEGKVPPWLRGSGHGWVTAEYAMLPRATVTRTPRERSQGKIGGRTYEIQRLVGRSLRSVVDLAALGERTIWLDCDVIQADGGTRTAAVTGAFVALVDALLALKSETNWERLPLTGFLAATSVGVVDETPLLDLAFAEDSKAAVDMNVVMTEAGELVEVQGTGEARPFSRTELDRLLALAEQGIARLIAAQKEALGETAVLVGGWKVAHRARGGVEEPS